MNEYEQAALRILEAFKELLRRDAGLARLNARIDAGLATYEDAERLSSLTGRELGELITRELLALFPSGPIPREAAEAILPPALRRNYEVVSKAAERVQKALNDRAGLGLAPVRPEHRQERDDNLITYTATQEDFASDAKHFVQLTENNSMMIVDDAVRDNADFHFGAGLSPRIVRKMRGRACAFCRERAGTFDYSVDMNKEVFRRHPNCHCTVEYNPGNGSRKRQNVHSKEWRNATGTERLRDFAEGKAEQLRAVFRDKREIERRKTMAYTENESIPGKVRELAVMAAQDGYTPTIPPEMDGNFEDFEPLTLSKSEEESLRALQSASVSTGFEFSQVIGENSFGDIHTDKLPGKVRFDLSSVDGDHLKVYHSHTNITPPSGQDFTVFSDPRVEKMGSIAPNGDCFIVKYSSFDDRPTKEEINSVIERIKVQSQLQIMDDPRFESWTPQERTYMTIRENTYQMARELGCEIQGGRLK